MLALRIESRGLPEYIAASPNTDPPENCQTFFNSILSSQFLADFARVCASLFVNFALGTNAAYFPETTAYALPKSGYRVINRLFCQAANLLVGSIPMIKNNLAFAMI
jgi:hypothetical protein